MVLFNSKKKYQYKLYERSSLFNRFKLKHRLKSGVWLTVKKGRKFRSGSILDNVYRTYHSVGTCLAFVVRLFLIINRVFQKLIQCLQQLFRIIQIVHGWIEMFKSIFSAVHLLVTRLMILIFKIYRIFYLLSILLEPLSNRSFEKALQSFSNSFYDYYSSSGACYTLKARATHVIGKIRARWRKSSTTVNEDDNNDIYFDSLDEEIQ